MLYTYHDAEADLRTALTNGDRAAIQSATQDMDRFDQPPRPLLLPSALWYAERRLRVFPLRPGSKVPHPHTRGCKDATTNPHQLRAWWDRWPHSNIGIATGHVIDVVDFDGELGHRSWGERYGSTWAGLHVLASVTTPRPGGLHIWVPVSGHGNRAALMPGVDYRGLGGYVVAPPSITYVGIYRFGSARYDTPS